MNTDDVRKILEKKNFIWDVNEDAYMKRISVQNSLSAFMIEIYISPQNECITEVWYSTNYLNFNKWALLFDKVFNAEFILDLDELLKDAMKDCFKIMEKSLAKLGEIRMMGV